MDAEQLTRGQLESEFSALARTMYFSRSTIASFAKEATRGQLVAVCDLIRGENATREENKKARLLRHRSRSTHSSKVMESRLRRVCQ